jgi:hypothetical protein
MALNDVLAELSQLNRRDKLRAMQFLVNELAAEERPTLEEGAEYTIYTPVGSDSAAQVLSEVLQAELKKRGR